MYVYTQVRVTGSVLEEEVDDVVDELDLRALLSRVGLLIVTPPRII